MPSSRRLKERYAPKLLTAIAAGKIAPGSLLTEDAVVARYAISRGAARELIQQAEQDGALEVQHGRGSKVRPPEQWNPLLATTIRARIESHEGPAVAADYFEGARWFAALMALAAAYRRKRPGLQLVADELQRLAAEPPRGAARGGSTVDACLLRAWGAAFDFGRRVPLGTHVGDALARGLELSVERFPALDGTRQGSLAAHQRLYDAAERRERLTLLGLLVSLRGSPSA